MKPVYKKIAIITNTTAITLNSDVVVNAFFDVVANNSSLTEGLNLQSQQVTATNTPAFDNSAAKLVITGVDMLGKLVVETIDAPTTGTLTVTTAAFFTSVTSVQAIDAGISDIQIGWDADHGDAVTAPSPNNWRQGPGNQAVAVYAIGTPTITGSIHYSLADPEGDFTSYTNDAPWTPVASLDGVVVSGDDAIIGPTRAIRGVLLAGSGASTGESFEFYFLQGDNH